MLNPERILARAGEGIVVLDHDLRYVFVNDAAVQILGVARETAIGRTPMDLFPAEAVEHVLTQIRNAIDSLAVVQFEAYHSDSDRWFENRIYPSGGEVSIFFADITTRKRAEEALIQHREMLSLAMRGGRMGAWSRNLVTESVWWSRELEDLFGLPSGGFDGTEAGFLAFVHPDDRRNVEAAVAEAVRSGDDYVVEFRFKHASGAWMWMEGRGRAAYDDDRRPRSLHGIGIDITERKAFEDQIAAARDAADTDAERLSIALAAARLGDWSWDAASDVVTCSPVAAQIFGIPPGPHMTWKAMLTLLHPDDRQRALHAVNDAVDRHTDYACEYRVLADGRERWISASGRCRYSDAGVPLEMYGVVQDITSDRLLVRLDDAVRPLVNPEEITYTAASLLGQHLQVNRCAYATVEEDEDSFILTGNYTHHAHSIVGRYSFRQFGAECLRLMRAGKAYVVDDSLNDLRIDEVDRAAYQLTAIRAVICVPVMKAGRFVAAMAVHTTEPRSWKPGEVELVQQVTSRCWESLERARVERERAGLLEAAEAANQAKDEFMAILGHELRNPLSPILTALHLMKLRSTTDSERERTVIERQVKHLTRLVDDLLDVSRIARGKVELKQEITELAEIVASAIEVASPLLEDRRHTVTVDVARTGLAVFGDPARLRQVISNLLTNAAKYTAPGGAISITASHAQDDVVLRVRDTGIGIPAEMLPRIFQMFVQSRRGIDRSDGGLGLGLTIVRNLVERHGGTVFASSEGVDKGSEFVVRLPAAQAVAGAPAHDDDASAARAAKATTARILVVDDNRDAAQLLAEALSLQGHETHVAHDGPSALSAAVRIRFDTALLDIGLPVMDGYELAVRLRAIEGLENIRLIAVTGYGQEADRHRATRAGFDRHLVKPVDLDLLAQTIAEPGGDGQEA